jgi:hypothetical protein
MPDIAVEKPRREISDEAIKAKTGKTREQWFKILDKAGAAKMNHSAIASLLFNEQGCPGWWSQMVAVEYERARGLRSKHETPAGYQVSATKTINAPLSIAFRSWLDAVDRRRWLGDDFQIRLANENKNIRAVWVDGKSSLEIRFYSKGDNKTQITVDHTKLPDAGGVTRMKNYWSAALNKLRDELEKVRE